MNNAFLFDMDGVIIDSENMWSSIEQEFYPQLFGKEILKKIGSTIGLSLDVIYEKAENLGFKMDKATFYNFWDEQAEKVYRKANITNGINQLAEELQSNKFKLGLVSASKQSWINLVLPRLTFTFNYVISLHERPDLIHKPAPDGYLEAIKKLGATPETTIILEDSNTGIQSGKAAGAFVIGLKQNLVPGYIQEGADVYANDINEVMKIVENELTKIS